MNQELNRVQAGWLALPLFTVVGLFTACTAQPQEVAISDVDQTLGQMMSADSQYMMRALATKGGDQKQSMQIDLADPAQQRFVMNRLAAAGKTTENSPYLFERLAQSRAKALARAASGVTAEAVAFMPCRNLITLGKEVKTTTTTTQFRTTHPNVTCVGGAAYVYADISTFNANTTGTENFLVQSAAGEDYTGGTRFSAVAISPTLPAKFGRINKTDSLVIAFDDLGNEQQTFFAVQSAMTEIPGSIAIAHPVLHSQILNGGNIQMCQLRGSPSQCDYAVGNLAGAAFAGWTAPQTGIAAVKAGTGTTTVPWQGDTANYFAFPALYNSTRIYLPLQGTINVGANLSGPCVIGSIAEAKVDLIKETTGGPCTTTSLFTAAVTFPANSQTATFKTTAEFLNDGGTPAANCSLSAIVNESVSPRVRFRVNAVCGGVPAMRFLTLAPDGASPAIAPHVFFLNSCFAAGTGVRRADGKSVAIEALKAGDKVIADSKGTVLTVTGVSHGGEDEPLVELRDSKGHKLQVTAKHPLIKASGEVVFASSLKKDDQVMTDRGIASIVSTKRVPYTGQVYNLSLGTPDEKAKVGKDGTTMFAGGFLAGDSAMQQAHDTPRPAVAALSAVWARDYQHAVANNPPMMRALR